MPFLSIIKAAENQGAPPAGLLEAMDTFVAQSLQERSVIQTGGLAPSAAGFKIRMTGGKLVVTDGPFTEAKEVVGGYARRGAPVHGPPREALADVGGRVRGAGGRVPGPVKILRSRSLRRAGQRQDPEPGIVE
jgi:hypothetical protein